MKNRAFVFFFLIWFGLGWVACPPNECPTCPKVTTTCEEKVSLDASLPEKTESETKISVGSKVEGCSLPTSTFFDKIEGSLESLQVGNIVRCEELSTQPKEQLALQLSVQSTQMTTQNGLKRIRFLYTTRYQKTTVLSSASLYLPLETDGTCKKKAAIALVGHGTLGKAASCSASHFPNSQDYLTLPLVSQGWAVLVPDYIGLGYPHPKGHPYLVSEPTENAMLDAVQSILQLREWKDFQGCLGNKMILLGHSQGGHAVLRVAHKIEKELPAMELKATVAIAPALGDASLWNVALPKEWAPTTGTSYLLSFFYSLSVYYQKKPPSEWLQPEMFAKLSSWFSAFCFTQVDSFLQSEGKKLNQIFTKEFLNQSLVCNGGKGDCSQYPWYQWSLDEQIQTAPRSKVLFLQGLQDYVVSASSVACGVERLVKNASSNTIEACYRDKEDHLNVVSASWKMLLPWLQAILEDKTPPTLECSNTRPSCKP